MWNTAVFLSDFRFIRLHSVVNFGRIPYLAKNKRDRGIRPPPQDQLFECSHESTDYRLDERHGTREGGGASLTSSAINSPG